MKSISAAGANRYFSKLLNEVAGGEVVTVLSRGKLLAIISPVKTLDTSRKLARLSLQQRLSSQKRNLIGKWSRDELYQD
jgi:antitoxin (DNA-binding transcriptional repressor) of toxin-antitoxin stability system